MITKVNKKVIGRYGEDQAAKFLLNNSYKIIYRNYYIKGCGEIDIIAEESGYLVILEVKTRLSNDFNALAAVDLNKQKKLARLAEFFIYQNDKYRDWLVRFDVVGINNNKLSLIKDAFIIM
ncbi:MAG: YraN family protein [bacterium]|nr:YraN family protein [bacterium]